MYKYLHGKLLFSPDGKEVFWVITTADKGVDINKRLFLKQKPDGTWTPPVESFLSTRHKENGPSYSADAKQIYYQSRASLNGKGVNKDIDIWYRERSEDGWGEPINIGKPINSNGDDCQPWVTADGSMFFNRDNETIVVGQSGKSDIYYSKFMDGQYSEPICLGPEINSEYHDIEAVVSPDNSYLLFISNRPGGFSDRMNLYVSFRNPDGDWTKARCISHELKIENIWFPTLSYDGKYLFFCGGYPVQYGGYSNSNYYWVDTEFIENIRTK